MLYNQSISRFALSFVPLSRVQFFLFSLSVHALLLIVTCLPGTVEAGGGPENLLLVVNERSWASQTIANYYSALRGIPDSHVVYLDWSQPVEITDVETFRQEILEPVVKAIQDKQLSQQIDYIVYSADFPYGINYRSDLKQEERWAVGSITGLTYLAPLVMLKETAYRGRNVNWYMRPWQMRPGEAGSDIPTSRGFRTVFSWMEDGQIGRTGGQHYSLSTMLGYTSGRGNSVSEVINYLRRSSQVDGSRPQGSIYFARTGNVRSTTRHFAYPLVVDELRRLGVHAEIINGTLPQGRKDVSGLAMGAADFEWKTASNQILPGAICDNFTSFGGVLRESSTQTPLTDFLRHGAAASSGTVVEPYSIIQKFPHPIMHVHYVRGCSLAEAFYQSVHGPHQLLIVGDPLCMPWARIPQVKVGGITANQTVQGMITISPTVVGSLAGHVHHFEIFLSGKRIAIVRPGKVWLFDTSEYPDGYHELRVVAFEASALQMQGRDVVPLTIANTDQVIRASVTPVSGIRWNDSFTVSAESTGAREIIVFQNRRVLGKIQGAKGNLELVADQFGLGPIRLQLAGISNNGGSQKVLLSKPIHIDIKPPMARSSLSNPPIGLMPGLSLERQNVTGQISIQKTTPSSWLVDLGMQPQESYLLSGYTKVLKENVYQFQLSVSGEVQLYINGDLIYARKGDSQKMEYIPVTLKPGWHEVNLRGTFAGKTHLSLAFGGPGAFAVGDRQFHHVP